jgi:hypothetical protein
MKASRKHGRAAVMRKLALVFAGALALTIAASSGASAATPIVNQHSNLTETFPDTVCGIQGTTTVSTVDNFKLYADNTFLDTATFHTVFTADNGKSVMIFAAVQTSGPAEPIQNADGTVTFVTTYKGLPEKISIPGGPTLSLDAGTATIATTLLPPPNGDFQFVSMTVSGENGPHPDLDSGFQLLCNLVIPALT